MGNFWGVEAVGQRSVSDRLCSVSCRGHGVSVCGVCECGLSEAVILSVVEIYGRGTAQFRGRLLAFARPT